MPDMTPEQQANHFKFRTDPTYHAIIEELVRRSVADDDANHKVKARAAFDFFIFGTAMVSGVEALTRKNLPFWHFAIDEGDGTATFTGQLPDGYSGPEPVTFAAADYVLLTLPDGLVLPTVVDDVVTGWEPWVAAWEAVVGDLDTLLG